MGSLERSSFYTNKALWALLGIVVLMLFYSLINRFIHIDDAWLGEQAFWFSKRGYVKSELFRGLIGYETQQLFYHKLFIWLGGLLITVFGFNLYVLKGLSLASLCVFIVIFIRFQKQTVPTNQTWTLLILITILIHPLVFHYSFVYRPEVILMTTGFASFIFLYHSTRNKSNIYATIAGALAGVACLIHLNGLSIAFAGFFAIAFQKDIKLVAYYVLGGLVTSLFYFADLNNIEDFKMMVYQFQNDPALTKDEFSVFQHLLNIFREHQRFFWDLTSGAFSVFFLGVFFLGFKGLRGYKFLKIYTLFAILVLAGLAHSKTTKYMLIYLPYLWLILLICINYIHKERQFLMKYIAVGGAVYLGISLFLNISLLQRNRNVIKKHATVIESFELKDQKIIAPMDFIFGGIENVEIQGIMAYKFFRERNIYYRDVPFNFYQIANHFDRSALILKRENFEELGIEMPSIGEVKAGFELVGIVDNNYFIYKRL